MTQRERLLDCLRHVGEHGITPMDAWQNLGIYRLGARIHDLRNEGHEIVSERVDVNNRFGETCRVARYRLVESVPSTLF